jgi:hypothetical protein
VVEFPFSTITIHNGNPDRSLVLFFGFIGVVLCSPCLYLKNREEEMADSIYLRMNECIDMLKDLDMAVESSKRASAGTHGWKL